MLPSFTNRLFFIESIFTSFHFLLPDLLLSPIYTYTYVLVTSHYFFTANCCFNFSLATYKSQHLKAFFLLNELLTSMCEPAPQIRESVGTLLCPSEATTGNDNGNNHKVKEAIMLMRWCCWILLYRGRRRQHNCWPGKLRGSFGMLAGTEGWRDCCGGAGSCGDCCCSNWEGLCEILDEGATCCMCCNHEELARELQPCCGL